MLHQPTYAPVPMLAADVNCFWALEQDQESYNREVYLPDAYIEVIINVGAPLVLESEHGMLELPRAFVNPLQNKPLRFRLVTNHWLTPTSSDDQSIALGGAQCESS